MATNIYDIGNVVRCYGTFTDAAGAAVDPTVVKMAYQDPAGKLTIKTYLDGAAIVKDSAGHYHCDIDVTVPGDWYYRWYSTGIGQAASEGQFKVRQSTIV